MALNFSYTLSPDENASWTKFKDFAKKVSGQEIKINLDIAGGNTGVDPLKKIVENVDRSGKALTSKVELIQERLYNSLNNLTIKADKNLLEGILPIDEISKQIDSLANSGKSLNQIRTEASQIRIELQQWGQVLSNDKALLEGINDLQGNIGKKIDEISKKKNSKHITQLKQETDEWLKSEIEAIKKTKEFQAATETQKSAFDKLTNSMEINAYSVEGLSKQKTQLNQQLKEQRQLFEDRYLDEARRKYDDLQGSIKNLVVRYVSLQAILHNMKKHFQDAIQYTMDLDSAYTDVAISMDVTRQEFNEWTKTARTIAQANGQTTTSLMEMVKIYATAGESIEAVQDKLAGTAMIQNITQWDAEQTTSAVNSILNQYKLLEKEINGVTGNVSNAITYLGDNLIGISNALEIDNVKGIQEMVSAIDTSGSIVESAGGTMEWYMGVTGALGEAMNATGAEVGNAMKMIAARTLQQKQVIEDMGESVENFEIETANAEAALNDIGVSIRGQGGELRDLEDILGDVATKWNDLSDSTQQFIGEKLAGNNRRSYFTAMMENYARVLELQQAGLNSSGELMKANEIRVESLAGQINILKDKMLAFSDGLQPAIASGVQLASTLMDLVNGFGAIPTTITLAGTSLLTFTDRGKQARDMMLTLGESHIKAIGNINTYIARNKVKIEDMKNEIAVAQQTINQTLRDIEVRKSQDKSIANLVTNLKTEQAALRTTQIELAKTTIKTYALQTAMSFGLSVAISAVVSGMGKLVEWLKDYTDYAGRAKEATENITKLSSELKNLTTGDIGANISQLDEMVQKYNNINTTQEEKAKLSEEINRLKQQLIGYDDEYAKILNNEKLSYEEQLALLKQINKEKSLETAQNLEKTIKKSEKDGSSSTGQWNYNQLTNNAKNIAELEKAIQEAQNGLGTYRGERTSVEKLEQILNDQKKRYQEHYLFLLDYNNKVEQIRNAGIDTDLQYFDVTKFQDMFHDLTTGIGNAVEEGSSKILVPIKTAKDKLQDFFGTDYDSSNVRDAFDVVVSACGGVQEGTEEAREALALLKQTFPQLGSEVDTLSEAIAYLGNKSMLETRVEAEELVEILNRLKESEQDALDTSTLTQLLDMYPELGSHINDVAYIQEFLNDKIQEMQQVNDNVYSSLLATDENFWNQKIKNSDEWLAHEKEVQNAITQLGAEMLGIQEQDFIDFINSKGGLRDVDLSNAKNAANAEGKLSADLLNQLLGWYSQYVGEKGGARITDLDNVAEFLNEQGGMEAKTVEELVSMWKTYYNAKKAEIQSSLALLSNSINAGNPYQDLGNLTPAQSAQMAELNKQMVNLEKSAAAMGNFFNSVTTSFKGVSSSLSQASASVGKIGSGKGPSSSSSSSNKGSSSSKNVADLELAIDRYYELNDAIDDVNNALEMNRQLQKMATNVATTKKLHEEEIKLLNEKLEATKKLQLEQRNDMLDHKNLLSTAGFSFDGDGNLTNYSSRLKELQNYANSLSGDAKEAQIAYVNSIVDIIDAYTTLTNNSLPSTELAIEQLTQEIKDVNKEHEKTLKLVEALGDRYYEINGLINDVDKKLAINQAKQQNATASERVKLMQEEIDLMKEKQDLLVQQGNELKVEADELKKKLSEQGVEFNTDGTIKNYKQLMDKYKTIASQYVGDSRDEVLDEAEELIDLIEKYDDIIRNSLPDLVVEWEDYTASIKKAEEAMAQTVTNVQKDITSAIENELQKRTDAVKTELQKQKDLYNKQFDEEDWEDSLNSEQRKLDEIQQQINNLSRDTSLAGQLKLQQLRDEYEAQQKVINDMIKDKEKENGNNRFDEEMEKIDKELEEALDPKNMADLVNKALVDGFVTIGDEVIELDTLMTDWLSDTGDGLYAIGDLLREELINNLRTAQELMAGMGITSTGVTNSGVQLEQSVLTKDLENKLNNALTTNTNNSSQNLDISIGSLIEVKGNVTEDVLPKLESMIEVAKTELIDEIASEIMKR